MRPKAPELRQGNPRGAKKESKVAQLTTVAEVPPPPPTLGPFGIEVWERVWELGTGTYATSDIYTVERYASMQERRRQYLDTLKEEGWTTVGSTGNAVMHPVARLLQDVEQKLVALEDRLGLSPEARHRLGIQLVEAQSKLEAFLHGG